MTFGQALATDLLDWPPSDQAILLWGSVATILLLLGAGLRWGSRIAGWVLRRLERRLRARPPRDTMRIVESPGRLRWNEGAVSGESATQVSGTWLVTNPMAETRTDLIIAKMTLRLPLRLRWRLNRDLTETESRLTMVIPWGRPARYTVSSGSYRDSPKRVVRSVQQ